MTINPPKKFKKKRTNKKDQLKKPLLKPIKAVQKFKFLIKGEESHNNPNVNDKPAEQSLSPIAQHLGIKDEIESHYPTDMLSERK